MSKIVKFTEVQHQWLGTAIVRNPETKVLEEVSLGVVQSDKKLKEVGAIELFTELPIGTVAVEVTKLVDVITTYEMDSEEFKKVAKLSDTPTETVPHEEASNEAVTETQTIVAHVNM